MASFDLAADTLPANLTPSAPQKYPASILVALALAVVAIIYFSSHAGE